MNHLRQSICLETDPGATCPPGGPGLDTSRLSRLPLPRPPDPGHTAGKGAVPSSFLLEWFLVIYGVALLAGCMLGGLFLGDLEAVACPQLDGVMLPKADTPGDVRTASWLLAEVEKL